MQELIDLIAPIASALVIIAFALPSLISVIRQKGISKGPLILLILGVFTLLVEGISIETGLPYGNYEYGSGVGFKLFDTVPWPIAFVYPPIIIGAFWIASKITKGIWRIFLTAVFALLIDTVIDPALTRMEIWVWKTPGSFYGVPIMNFAGWFVTGLAGAFILHVLWNETKVRRGMASSAFAIAWFWGGVNIGLNQWIPGVLGLVIGLGILVFMLLERRREKKEES